MTTPAPIIPVTDHSQCGIGEPCRAGRPVSEAPSRAIRCFKPDRFKNPCPNPALTEWGLCLRHLREASDEWARVIAEVTEHRPGAIYDATAGERGLE